MTRDQLNIRARKHYAAMWVQSDGLIGIGPKVTQRQEVISQLDDRANLDDKEHYVIEETKQYVPVPIEVTEERSR